MFHFHEAILNNPFILIVYLWSVDGQCCITLPIPAHARALLSLTRSDPGEEYMQRNERKVRRGKTLL